MTKVAVFGASGFVGQSCVAALESAGHDVLRRCALRLRSDGGRFARPPDDVLDGRTIAALSEPLLGCEVVVNAAGMPAASSSTGDLLGANAAWPYLLAHACRAAGVRRLVHVSTVAVQGRAAVLDASARCAPVNPYAESKARGEELLTRFASQGDLEMTIYRPPSVHAADRKLTRSFAAYTRRWPLVVLGDGNQPVPVALVGNVGAVVAALVDSADPPLVVTHPYEGYTVRSLYALFAPGRPVRSLPDPPVRFALRVIEQAGRKLPIVAVLSRRAELMLFGQAQAPSWLDRQGFMLPFAHAEWQKVARSAST